jgi:hypothetical protein
MSSLFILRIRNLFTLCSHYCHPSRKCRTRRDCSLANAKCPHTSTPFTHNLLKRTYKLFVSSIIYFIYSHELDERGQFLKLPSNPILFQPKMDPHNTRQRLLPAAEQFHKEFFVSRRARKRSPFAVQSIHFLFPNYTYNNPVSLQTFSTLRYGPKPNQQYEYNLSRLCHRWLDSRYQRHRVWGICR